jgi:uncharacterized protein (TIGR04255 family)
MAKKRQLQNPPIREAILEFQIAPTVNILPETFEKWSVPATYSPLRIQQGTVAKFQLNQDLTLDTDASERFIEGGIWHDTSRNIAAQIMRNRLTINKIAPYTDFHTLRDEAEFFLKQYRTSFTIEQIQRIGLRFVNEIIPQKPLHNYLIQDFIPQGALPKEAANVYYRYEIRRTETLGALIQIVMENDRNQSFPARLIVDIDTFSTRIYEVSDGAVWEEAVEQLHEFKNDLFFDIITEDFAKECE